MLDIKVIREAPDLVKEGARKKRFPDRIPVVDRVLELDRELRALLPTLEQKRAEQKAAGRGAGNVGAMTPEERERYTAEQRRRKEEIAGLEAREEALREELRQQMLLIPNVPAPEVPEGKDETENKEIRRVGEPPTFEFEARGHDELATAQGWLDVQRAAEMAGSRNYLLFGDLAFLQDAVMRYALDHMAAKGFVYVDPPLMVRDAAMIGTAFFPGGEEQTYRVERDGLNLIGTSEVPVTSIHAGEILDEERLPLRYAGRSACFRREAGTYGKDTRGLYRVHQFQKVEQVVVDIADEARSRAHHEDILRNAEQILQSFGLPYRVVAVCGGDLGVPQVMKYDIECWMPSRNGYGETHSASRFHDFQARRLNLRYRRKADGKTAFCHTLNNTVVASPRILIPLLEVGQRADGTVRVPDVLAPYLGGRTVLGKPLPR